MNIDYNAAMEILKNFLENEKTEILGISVGQERQVRDAIKNLLTAYEKEKEKNKELENCLQMAKQIMTANISEDFGFMKLKEFEEYLLNEIKQNENFEE